MKRLIVLTVILTLLSPLFAFDFFADEETVLRKVAFTLESGLQYYPNNGDVTPIADITLKAEQDGSNYKALAELSYDATEQALQAQELSVSLFLGPFTLKGGLFRHSWGTADTAHVVDVVNARDLRKGIIDDLEMMKRPDWMLTLSTYWKRSSLDLVLKPGFYPTHMVMDGRYSMVSSLDDLPAMLSASGYTLNPIDLNAIQINEMTTHNLSRLSGGVRFRHQFEDVDLGLIYYNGYYGEPGLAITIDPSDAPPAMDLTQIDLTYTRYQLFGFESSVFLEPFTLSFEGGYFLSEDKDGSNPSLYNSKAAYLAEISYTNPTNAFFAALNYQGQFVFDFKESDLSLGQLDVDDFASFNNKAYQNTFTLALEYPFMQERLKARLAGTYQVESMGYAILASLTYDLDDAVELFGKSTIYGTFDDKRQGLYTTWKNNSWIQVGVRAWF